MAKSRALTWILVILVVLASSAAAAAFYLLYQDRSDDGFAHAGETLQQAAAPAVAAAPIYVSLDPFTVNLSEDGDGPRLLYAGLTLKVKDAATQEALATYRPQVRNRLVLLLSGKAPGDISHAEGKQLLADEIVARLSDALDGGQTELHIDQVLFTEFIVQ